MSARAGYCEYLAKRDVSTHAGWCEYLAQGTEAHGTKASAEETLVPRGLVYSKSIRARVQIPAVIGTDDRSIGTDNRSKGSHNRSKCTDKWSKGQMIGVSVRIIGVRVRAGALGEH